MLLQILLTVAGLVTLTLGADWLVRGASRLALLLRISPLVIGLSIVAFGTSAPEMAVSVTSARAGSPDIAIANVVGSNIFNILLILGGSALVAPLVVAHQLVRMDVPIMLGASLLLYSLAMDGHIGLWDAGLLAAIVIAYTGFLIRESRRESALDTPAEQPLTDATTGSGRGTLLPSASLVIAGLALLVAGSKLFVGGAIEIARAFAVSELLIGLTLVAAGTSLPELATSVVAAYRGERDIAVGNVVGSNIFNICAVLGLTGLVSHDGLSVPPGMLAADIPIMVGVAFLCLPLFRAGFTLSRSKGALFLALYGIYLLFLAWEQTAHPGLDELKSAAFDVLLPTVIIGTVIYTVAALKQEERG